MKKDYKTIDDEIEEQKQFIKKELVSIKDEQNNIETAITNTTLPEAAKEELTNLTTSLFETYQRRICSSEDGSSKRIMKHSFSGVAKKGSPYVNGVLLYDRMKEAIIAFAESEGFATAVQTLYDIDKWKCEDKLANFYWGEAINITAKNGDQEWSVQLGIENSRDRDSVFGDFRIYAGTATPTAIREVVQKTKEEFSFREGDKEKFNEYTKKGSPISCNYCGEETMYPPKFPLEL